MHENTLQWTPCHGYWWWHRWKNGDAAVVRMYVSKFRVWRPIQQRPRDGTVIRHRTGGLRKAG